MRITPLEIRQKSFEKHFRGYDKDEVNAFLLTLSQEWERIVDENKEYRIKLESAEREVSKLREVEGSLFKTLKTAEDTGANVVEQARQAADLRIKESQLKADSLLNEAKLRAKSAIDEADQRAREILLQMEERLKALTDSYKRLESSREDLLNELKHIASDIIDRTERARNSTKDFNPDKYLTNARMELRNTSHSNTGIENPLKEKAREQEIDPLQESQMIIEKQTVVIESQPKKFRSFFDEIG